MSDLTNYDDLKDFLKKCTKARKKKKSKWERIYLLTLSNFKFFLMDTICMLNGIERDDYFFEDGFPRFKKFKFNKDFKDTSFLHFDEKANSIYGARYRARYLTMLYFYFFKNIEKIVNKLSKKIGDESYKTKINILKDVIVKLNTFTVNFSSNNGDYSNSLKELMNILMITDGNKKNKKVMKIVTQQGEIVKDACKNKHLYDEDVMINNIIKLAYVTATTSTDIHKCPKFKEGVTKSDRDNVKKQVRKLGKAICYELNKRKTPEFYKVYTNSRPIYYSNFKDINEDDYLNIGTKALTYLKFILNDKKCNRFINSIIMN